MVVVVVVVAVVVAVVVSGSDYHQNIFMQSRLSNSLETKANNFLVITSNVRKKKSVFLVLSIENANLGPPAVI